MRKLNIALLVLVLFVGATAHAQSSLTTVPCEQCRNPFEHPEDYANHAFNQVYGPDAWMDFDQADDFFILGPEGLRVYVDVDFVFLGIGIEGLRLPLWPTYQLLITIALPDGEIRLFLRSTFQSPLPVPANLYDQTPDPENGPATDDESGSEADDEDSEWDTVEEEPEEPEIDDGEYVGHTDIVDPDENGDFPELEWCEEC